MSFQRSILVAIATLITVGMTQVAFAGCCDWGGQAPVAQAPVAYIQTGCGGCGAVAYAPVIYATPIAPQPIAVGCGNCGAPVSCCAPSVAAAYAAPVAQWGGGCGGGCGGQVGYGVGYGGGYSGCGNCGIPAVYTAPAPLYVVNQGPAFDGPGLMVPFHSYAPPVEYAPAPVSPPYEGGYGGGYAGGYGGGYAHPYPMHRYYPHVAYGGGYYHPHMMAPRYYGPRPMMMHRPY